MAEFKVGDLVEIVENDWTTLDKGTLCMVIAVSSCPCRFPYEVMSVDGGKGDWIDSGSLRLVAGVRNNQAAYIEEPDECCEESPAEATPIDLPTVKFIYEQWANILGAKGITDEAAADIFGGYISGLMQGLKGDLND